MKTFWQLKDNKNVNYLKDFFLLLFVIKNELNLNQKLVISKEILQLFLQVNCVLLIFSCLGLWIEKRTYFGHTSFCLPGTNQLFFS